MQVKHILLRILYLRKKNDVELKVKEPARISAQKGLKGTNNQKETNYHMEEQTKASFIPQDLILFRF